MQKAQGMVFHWSLRR